MNTEINNASSLEKETTFNILNCFAASNNNPKILHNSSSGGIFFELASTIINNNGVVFGAAFDANFMVHHIAVSTLDGLPLIMKAKYVKSNLSGCFELVKNYLLCNKEVLFSGTPCQIAGLLSYLKQPYSNLFTVAVICHGTPNPSVWNNYLKHLLKKYNSPISSISFRDKSNGWQHYNIKITFANHSIYCKDHHQDVYMKGFQQNLFLQSSCYHCTYKQENIKSDLILGDFWGISHLNTNFSIHDGISAVIVRTKKGQDLYDRIHSSITSKKVDFTDIVSYNPALIHPADKNIFYHIFKVVCLKTNVLLSLKLFTTKPCVLCNKIFRK